MIVAPARRLWLYQTSDGALEILVLGDDDSVAAMYARIRSLAESWRGFDRVQAIAQGNTALGVRVTLSISARRLDPIAEFMRALRDAARDLLGALTWIASADQDPCGLVATW